MSVEDISLADLDTLSEDLSSAAAKVTNAAVKEQLNEIRKRVVEMRVARIEIDHLNDEFHRGNHTQDFYSVKHKQLTTDFVRSRDRISDYHVEKISDLAPDAQSRGRVSRFLGALKNNKEFVIGLSQLIVNIISIFGGTAIH